MKNSVIAMGFGALVLMGCGPTASDFQDGAAADSDGTTLTAKDYALNELMMRFGLAGFTMVYDRPTLERLEAQLGPATETDSGFTWNGDDGRLALTVQLDPVQKNVISMTAGPAYLGPMVFYSRGANSQYWATIGHPLLRDGTPISVIANANEIYDGLAGLAGLPDEPHDPIDCLATKRCITSEGTEPDGTTSYRFRMNGIEIDTLPNGNLIRVIATPDVSSL